MATSNPAASAVLGTTPVVSPGAGPRPATDAQVRVILASYDESAATHWRAIDAWCSDRAPDQELPALCRAITAKAHALFQSPVAPVDPRLVEWLARLDPSLSQPDAIAALRAAAPGLLLLAPALRAQALASATGPGLAAVLQAVRTDLPRSLWAHATATALASAYDLTVSPAQAKTLEPLVRRQGTRLLEILEAVITRLQRPPQANLLLLLDALLTDLTGVQRNHLREREGVAGAAKIATAKT